MSGKYLTFSARWKRHWLNNVPSCFLKSCQLVAHKTLAIKNFHSLIPRFRRNPLLFLFSWSFFWNHLLSFHLCPSQIVIILQTSNIPSQLSVFLPDIQLRSHHPWNLWSFSLPFSDSTISLLRCVGAEPKGIQDVIAPLIHTSVMTSSVSFTVSFWKFPIFPLAVLTAAEGWADILRDLSVINNLKSSFLSGNSQLRAPKTPDMEKVGWNSEFSYFYHTRWVIDYQQQGDKLSSTGLAEATADPASVWDLY